VVVGDFNRDGAPDLATATHFTNNVTILLGSGHGSFGALTASSFAPTGAGPRWIVGGDFNNDGKLDLATANREANTVSVLLGNGDGTFGTNADFVTGAHPVGIAAGDFNGDGIPDLVTADTGGSVSVLLGQGGGVFAAHLDFLTGSSAVQVVVGDFNGDGRDDIAVAGFEGFVSILLGRGDGTFTTPTEFPTGSGLSSLAVGDFNGDGVLDLVTANSLGRSASLLLGGGDGTFDHRTDPPTADIPLQVVAADFNADGRLDFLTASAHPGCAALICAGSLTLYLGNGDGTFRGPFGVGTGPAATGIAAADINADGKLDLAIADGPNDGVDILLQSAHVTLEPDTLVFESQPLGTTSSPHTVTVQSTGSFPLNITSVGLTGVDADQFSITTDRCSQMRLPRGWGAPSRSCSCPRQAGRSPHCSQSIMTLPTASRAWP
jgi:hypothetical protein